jgi:hypothetical protein
MGTFDRGPTFDISESHRPEPEEYGVLPADSHNPDQI